MTPWPVRPLSELVEPDRGISYGIVQPGVHCEGGIPIIRVSDIRHGRIETAHPLRVSPDIETAHSRTRLSGGELLLTLVGTVGEAAIVPPDLVGWNVARAVGVISVKQDVGSHWVRYALAAPAAKNRILQRLNTTVQATLNLKDVAELPVSLPPAHERKVILGILRSLDDKIELNRRMNETLEAMARAFFKDWFIDFGPVRAKMEGRQPLGLSSEIAALFPDKLDEQGKPEGFRNGVLSDVSALNPESWAKNDYPDAIEYVDLANTKWGTIESTAKFDRASAPSRAQRILRPGDTIVGTVRPANGSYSYVSRDGLTGSTGFAVLRAEKESNRAFVYLAATEGENIERLAHLADGGAYPAVRPDVVANSEVVIPRQEILNVFSVAVRPLVDRMEQNKAANESLGRLRDLLLPGLLSGEIRVGVVPSQSSPGDRGRKEVDETLHSVPCAAGEG